MSEARYDYIVIGAGSAGCVLANRLSFGGKHSVLLIEAGPRDRYWWIHVPLGYGKTMFNPTVNWCSRSAPVPALYNRSIYAPRGKVLGGTSSINGMICIRGQPQDFDTWRDQGNPGWGWSDILPYFRKLENHCFGVSEYHGVGGPLTISTVDKDDELICAFIDAAASLGLPRNDDFNGPTQEGVGFFEVATSKGWRASTAQTYLKQSRKRANLTVETNALVDRIAIEDCKATGVHYWIGGERRWARADGEVIVSAGAFGSPLVLQRSGVGDGELLAHHGITVARHLVGVGRNLQDHLQFRISYRCNKSITTNDDINQLHRRFAMGLRYLFLRKGALATGINLAGLFARVRPDASRTEVQLHFGTLSADAQGGKVHPFSGFTIAGYVLRPESRGTVAIAGPDPTLPPIIEPDSLASEYDRQTLLLGVKLARHIAATPPLERYIAEERDPGASCVTDEQLMSFIRRNANGLMHPAGTCRMGRGKDSVVDERLRVHGIGRLRVVDASIMPEVTSGNTNLPTIMIGEKASDMILEDATALTSTTLAESCDAGDFWDSRIGV